MGWANYESIAGEFQQGKVMLVVAIPFHAGDAKLALALARWIGKLGSVKEFDCVLIVDAGTPIDIAVAVKEEAEEVFKSAPLVTNAASVSGWIAGANSLWYRALDWAAENGRSVLFLEPDAIPLRPGWLQELEAAYSDCGKAHMGHIAETNNSMLPPRCMSGVAIYGPEAARWPRPPQKQPFNVFYADLLLQNAADTKLIQDFFGTKELPPFFLDDDIPNRPTNAFPLDWLPREVVLFHRDKTHSLIPLLAKKLVIEWQQEGKRQGEKIVVVFPVHGGDLHLALHHTMWLRKMNTHWPHRAIIAFDPTTPTAPLNQLHSLLEPCFSGGVEFFRYPHFPGVYPHVANFAFQSVAHHMAQGTAPWFWCEPDLVVLRPDWLKQLQVEYERAQKSWMGPLVHQMGHMNGTSVYPPDAAHRMPRAMACGAGQAFDMEMKEETLHDRHDCGHLLHHVWSILNDAPCPVGGGQVPGPITAEQARRWLPREAVATHRWKTRHLIDLLLTGQYRHE